MSPAVAVYNGSIAPFSENVNKSKKDTKSFSSIEEKTKAEKLSDTIVIFQAYIADRNDIANYCLQR